MRFKKIVTVLCAALLCVAVFSGCVQDNREVLTVNGDAVTKGKFMFFLSNMKDLIAQESDIDVSDENAWSTVEIDNQKAIDVAKDKAVDDIVNLMVQVQHAEELGMKITNEDQKDINKQKSAMITQYGGEDAFNQKLGEWQISSDAFTEIITDYKYAAKLRDQTIAEDEKINNITEEDIQAQYDQKKEEYNREAITAKHIVILLKPDGKPERTDEQARALAQEVLDKLNAGGDFDTLMREYSEDIESSYEGYSFIHNDGQFDITFDNAAYALAVGETSGLVKTDFGYHIIRRLPPQEEFSPLADVRDQIIELIKSERYDTLVDEWVSQAVIEKKEPLFSEIK